MLKKIFDEISHIHVKDQILQQCANTKKDNK